MGCRMRRESEEQAISRWSEQRATSGTRECSAGRSDGVAVTGVVVAARPDWDETWYESALLCCGGRQRRVE